MEVDPVEVAPDGPTEEGAAAQPGEGGAATGDKPQREPSAVSLDIPKARVRKIMKADEDVKMIKPDALTLVTKSAELFVAAFIGEAYNYTKFDKRKTIRMKDLECVLRDVDLYDFLLTDESLLSASTGQPEAKRKKTREGSEKGEGEEGDEHDFWLPQSNIRRLTRAKLELLAPEGQKIAMESTVVAGLVRATTVFISLLTACALETCGKRTTITCDNVYRGLHAAEFDDFVPDVKSFASKAGLADESDGTKPKRALSGFFRFSQLMREKVRKEHPEVASSVGETAKLLGNLWRHLTEEERQAYKPTNDGKAGAGLASPAAGDGGGDAKNSSPERGDGAADGGASAPETEDTVEDGADKPATEGDAGGGVKEEAEEDDMKEEEDTNADDATEVDDVKSMESEEAPATTETSTTEPVASESTLSAAAEAFVPAEGAVTEETEMEGVDAAEEEQAPAAAAAPEEPAAAAGDAPDAPEQPAEPESMDVDAAPAEAQEEIAGPEEGAGAELVSTTTKVGDEVTA